VNLILVIESTAIGHIVDLAVVWCQCTCDYHLPNKMPFTFHLSPDMTRLFGKVHEALPKLLTTWLAENVTHMVFRQTFVIQTC